MAKKTLTYWKVRLRHVGIYTGNGYCRSETVGTVFIQKASDAKRIYATVVHTGNNADGNKEQGETNRDVQKVHNKHLSLGCSGTVHGGGCFLCVCMCWKNGGHGEEVVWCGSSRKQVDACFKHLFVLGPHWVPQMHKLTPLSWEPSAAWSRQEYSFTCFTCCQGSYCPVAVDWTLNVG